MDRIVETQRETGLTSLIAKARTAATQGDCRQAYQASLKATRQAPRQIDGWLIRAECAPSVEEKLLCLNQIHTLDPENSHAQTQTYFHLRNVLEQEPFLQYLDENENLYYVRNGIALDIVVPKYRNRPEDYPKEKPPLLRRAQTVLVWAVFGLLLAGLGTLLFAPLSAGMAFFALYRSKSRSDQVRALIVMALSTILWAASFPLLYLLILHIQG